MTLLSHQVAQFLRVNPDTGLFFFDSSYRPVPLAQQYIGISEQNFAARTELLNEICYKKVSFCVCFLPHMLSCNACLFSLLILLICARLLILLSKVIRQWFLSIHEKTLQKLLRDWFVLFGYLYVSSASCTRVSQFPCMITICHWIFFHKET